MGTNPRVVSVLRDRYTLPFKQRPLLTRSPLVLSGYANPTKSRFLKEALLNLAEKTGSGESGGQVVSGFLQSSLSCPKTQQKMEANLGSKPIEPILENQYFQDGNSGDNSVILTERGMGNFAGLQRCIFSHSNQPVVQKIPVVLPKQSDFSIHSSSLWVGHSSPRVYKGGQGSETDGTNKGYPNPPVPRRLVAESPVPGNLPTTYPDPLGPLPAVGMGGQLEEIRVRTPASLQFRRLPIQPIIRSGSTHSGPVVSSAREIKLHQEPEQLHSPTVHVADRTAYSHRKASLVGTSSYEAHPVALETSLARPKSTGKDHTSSLVTPSTPKLVVGRAQHFKGPTFLTLFNTLFSCLQTPQTKAGVLT